MPSTRHPSATTSEHHRSNVKTRLQLSGEISLELNVFQHQNALHPEQIIIFLVINREHNSLSTLKLNLNKRIPNQSSLHLLKHPAPQPVSLLHALQIRGLGHHAFMATLALHQRQSIIIAAH